MPDGPSAAGHPALAGAPGAGEHGIATMARILLVEAAPDLGLFEAGVLEDAGHRVLRCAGAPTPLASCLMLRDGACPLPEAADLIVFSVPAAVPLRGHPYTGGQILRAYRAHPAYGRLPMVVVDVVDPGRLPGPGPVRFVPRFTSPRRVVETIERMLARAALFPPGNSGKD